MKKIFLLVLSIILVCTMLCGCGEKSNEVSEETTFEYTDIMSENLVNYLDILHMSYDEIEKISLDESSYIEFAYMGNDAFGCSMYYLGDVAFLRNVGKAIACFSGEEISYIKIIGDLKVSGMENYKQKLEEATKIDSNYEDYNYYYVDYSARDMKKGLIEFNMYLPVANDSTSKAAYYVVFEAIPYDERRHILTSDVQIRIEYDNDGKNEVSSSSSSIDIDWVREDLAERQKERKMKEGCAICGKDAYTVFEDEALCKKHYNSALKYYASKIEDN